MGTREVRERPEREKAGGGGGGWRWCGGPGDREWPRSEGEGMAKGARGPSEDVEERGRRGGDSPEKGGHP